MTHRTHFGCRSEGASYLISWHIFEYLRDPASLTTSLYFPDQGAHALCLPLHSRPHRPLLPRILLHLLHQDRPMTISLLPTELVEHVLISSAAGGFPQAIAAFSQTSRAYYDLVYHPKDHHLWREIFLTTFDDPRASGGGPGWAACASSLSRQDDFAWGLQIGRAHV